MFKRFTFCFLLLGLSKLHLRCQVYIGSKSLHCFVFSLFFFFRGRVQSTPPPIGINCAVKFSALSTCPAPPYKSHCVLQVTIQLRVVSNLWPSFLSLSSSANTCLHNHTHLTLSLVHFSLLLNGAYSNKTLSSLPRIGTCKFTISWQRHY